MATGRKWLTYRNQIVAELAFETVWGGLLAGREEAPLRRDCCLDDSPEGTPDDARKRKMATPTADVAFPRSWGGALTSGAATAL